MQGFYVFLAIAGIICVILSFFLVEKLEGNKGNEMELSEEMLEILLKNSEKLLDNSIKTYIEERKKEAIEGTKTALNRITNEKIMAVDEFSDTVLEKINQNHSEVIFLYNMLNEKEKELKDVVAEANQTVKEKKTIDNISSSHTDKHPKNTSHTNKNVSHTKKSKVEKVNEKKENSEKISLEKGNSSLSESEKKKGAHSRDEILSLYENGFSITDIAQKLKVGKGEVKLIVDLYQGAKG